MNLAAPHLFMSSWQELTILVKWEAPDIPARSLAKNSYIDVWLVPSKPTAHWLQDQHNSWVIPRSYLKLDTVSRITSSEELANVQSHSDLDFEYRSTSFQAKPCLHLSATAIALVYKKLP